MKHSIRTLPILLLAIFQIAAAPFTDTPIRAAHNTLGGTLRAPSSGLDGPLVIMIPGSGPTDRDGNSTLGPRPATLRLLADALAAQGIASLRVDKRGMFTSAAAAPDGNHATLEAYVTDIRAWIDLARTRNHGRCVWLLGHSEGASVALATAAQNPQGVCGLLLISPVGRPLREVLLEQFHATAHTAPRIAAALDTLQNGQTISDDQLPPALRAAVPPAVQPFLISMLRFRPASTIAGLRMPILLLHGQTDLQTSDADIQALHAANPSATALSLPGINHILREAPRATTPDTRAANIATYFTPGPLAPQATAAIISFVTHEPPLQASPH